MSDDAARLDEAAAELLALPPSRFTAARAERAASAGGDLGRRIAKLRKPTVAAWAVNLLVRDGQLGEAVELSRALHEAQDDLDAAELARLGRQRRQLVTALARRAGDLASEAGTPLSAAVTDAVEKTVNAAVVDPAVAAAVLTGRLVAAIDLADLDPGALLDAVAGSVPDVVPAPEQAPRDDLAARRARKAAERAVREAERARADAERARSTADTRLAAAREHAERVRARADGLRAELRRVEAEAAAADEEQRERESARHDAETAVREALRALESAEAARDAGDDA